MFLADWSGRRVAAYAITWLVGFPVLMTVAMGLGAWASVSNLRGHHPIGSASARAHLDSTCARRAAIGDSSAVASLPARPDSLCGVAFLPSQPGDVMVSLTVSETTHVRPGGEEAAELLPWLLPPVLLVAAWAWAQRSRPEPD